ncbi:MAG: hypothetical protein ABJA32_05525 [Ginsengibacter sp.]|jgi:hypothetical protein
MDEIKKEGDLSDKIKVALDKAIKNLLPKKKPATDILLSPIKKGR